MTHILFRIFEVWMIVLVLFVCFAVWATRDKDDPPFEQASHVKQVNVPYDQDADKNVIDWDHVPPEWYAKHAARTI